MAQSTLNYGPLMDPRRHLSIKKHLAKSAKVLFELAPAVGIEPTTN